MKSDQNKVIFCFALQSFAKARIYTNVASPDVSSTSGKIYRYIYRYIETYKTNKQQQDNKPKTKNHRENCPRKSF